MELTHRFIGKASTGLHTGPALPREIAEQQQADGYERPLDIDLGFAGTWML